MVAVPPSARPGFDLNRAYEVENKLKQWRQAAGHKSVGSKVGYANKAVWRVLKLETLVWEHMYDDTVHQSDANSATGSVPHARSLKIEPEIVCGLKQPITAGADAPAALAARDWLALGFEIIDCPFPEWKFQPSDFVAAFRLHAALVIGERMPVHSVLIPALPDDLARFKITYEKGWRAGRRGVGKELSSQSRAVSSRSQQRRSAAISRRAVERGQNRQLRDAYGWSPDRPRRSLDRRSRGTGFSGAYPETGIAALAAPSSPGIHLPRCKIKVYPQRK